VYTNRRIPNQPTSNSSNSHLGSGCNVAKPLPKSHSISFTNPSIQSALKHSSASSSTKSVDRNPGVNENFIHTVCGGYSNDTYRKKKDSKEQVINDNKLPADLKISTSLPSSIVDSKEIQQSSNLPIPKLRDKVNCQVLEEVLNNNHKMNMNLRPLMPTEPLMSLNVNIDKPVLSNNTANDLNKQQSDSNAANNNSNNYGKANEQLLKIEAEFVRNYVFRMKRVGFVF